MMGATQMIRVLAGLALVVAMAGTQARALDRQQAETVVALLEQLNDDIGPVAYDEEEGDRWFESDAEDRGLIPAAGFDQPGWKRAFDGTISGYLAALPEADFIAAFDRIMQRAAQSASLSTEQRQAMMAMIDEQATVVGRWRAEGRAHAAIIRPLLPRLQRLIPEN